MTEVTQQEVRILRLISGEQIVCKIQELKDKPEFLSLVEPMRMDIIPSLIKGKFIEERMALTEWLTHAKELNHSIHKSKILAVANANDSLAEYYGNVKEHLKDKKWKLGEERRIGKNEFEEFEKQVEFDKIIEDEDVFEYLNGRRTIH